MKKNNKGFSLVELIVVIVILAIIIGITIGGIYTYVGQSKKNTDIQNAESIMKVMSSLGADDRINEGTIKVSVSKEGFSVIDTGTTNLTEQDILNLADVDGLKAQYHEYIIETTLVEDGNSGIYSVSSTTNAGE